MKRYTQETIDKRNRYAVKGKVTILTITRLNGAEYEVKIDTADYPKVQKYLWSVSIGRSEGAYIVGGPNRMMLHRYLDETPADLCCGFNSKDHFDCRRNNLFRGGHSDITRRRDRSKASPAKGLHWNEHIQRWSVCKSIYIGVYKTVDEALAAQAMFTEPAVKLAETVRKETH